MPQKYFSLKSYAEKEEVLQDIEGQVNEWNDLKAKEVQGEECEGGSHGVIMVAMVVVCLSFLGIFRVPIWLEKELGFEAMEKVGFKIFLVMDTLSFFTSLGVVLALLQASAFDTLSHVHIKRLLRISTIASHLAMGFAAIAFVSAATMFTASL